MPQCPIAGDANGHRYTLLLMKIFYLSYSDSNKENDENAIE